MNYPIGKDYLIRAAALEGFVPLMHELGIDGAALIAGAGISMDALSYPDSTMSFAAFLDVLAAARKATGLQHIGLLIAERQSISVLGPLGFAMAHAPNLRGALGELNEFIHLHNTGNSVRLVTEGEMAMWRLEVLLGGHQGMNQHEDLALSIAVSILRNLLGRNWSPELVTLQRRAPMNTAPYRQVFRSPVEFEAEHSQVVFESTLLATTIAQSNSQLYGILDGHLRSLDASGKRDYATEVQQIILHAMKEGKCTLPRVAHLLGTSQRTLQRRLALEGRTFRDEVETARCSVAMHYLEQTAVSLTSLSMTLGYSDLAAFSFAFRRMTGMSPSAWRKAQRLSS